MRSRTKLCARMVPDCVERNLAAWSDPSATRDATRIGMEPKSRGGPNAGAQLSRSDAPRASAVGVPLQLAALRIRLISSDQPRPSFAHLLSAVSLFRVA